MATILAPRISNCIAMVSRPRGATTTPTKPLMSASAAGVDGARRAPASAPLATASAPRSSRGAPGGRAAASGGEKGLDDLALRLHVRVGGGVPSADPPARAARELPRRRRRAADDRGDVIEGHAEQIVQHECEPLRGREVLEHDEQREPYRVGQDGLLLRIHGVRTTGDRLDGLLGQGLFAPRLAGAQHVERHARDDGGQPAAEVLDVARVRAAGPQPRFLDRILGLAQRAEHPVGHAAQAASLRLEPLAQPRLVPCHIPSLRSVIRVTVETRTM